jgi:hypothetical protein
MVGLYLDSLMSEIDFVVLMFKWSPSERQGSVVLRFLCLSTFLVQAIDFNNKIVHPKRPSSGYTCDTISFI